MPTVLFVGGPRDGERVQVTELRPYLTVEKIPPRFCIASLWDSDRTMFQTVTYLLLPFAGEEERHHVYAADGLTADEVFRKLLAGYKPELTPKPV